MNKHIELVKRYLAGEVVSVEALKANADAAKVICTGNAKASADYVAYAAYAAYADAADATYADADAADAAAYWVKRYEEITK